MGENICFRENPISFEKIVDRDTLKKYRTGFVRTGMYLLSVWMLRDAC